MRQVQNRKQTAPVQEQEIVDRFITAAPGLPLAKCGGGVMPECKNMSIKNGRLELRKPLYNNFAARKLFAPPKGRRNFLMAGNGNFHLVSDRARWLRELESADVSIKVKTGEGYLPWQEGYYDSIDLQPFYGPLNLFNGNNKTRIINFEQFIARELGLLSIASPGQSIFPKQSYDGPGRYGWSLYIGVELVVKENYNGKETVMRSSGVSRLEGRLFSSGTLLFDYAALSAAGITHVRLYFSEIVSSGRDGVPVAIPGVPHELYMLFDIPIAGRSSGASVAEFGDESGSWTAETGIYNDWFDSFYKIEKPVPSGLMVKYEVPRSSSNLDEISGHDPDEADKANWPDVYQTYISKIAARAKNPEAVFEEAEINLVPMENAHVFAGNRLWGIYPEDESQLIYSMEAGLAWQEQRTPLSVVELGQGKIQGIAELDGDLYAFCEKGVSKIPGSDPYSEPRKISSTGGSDIRLKSVKGFGIFAAIGGTLLFLDANTKEFSVNCKGLDLNTLLGPLANKIECFEIFEGELYFIAAGRLFKINMLENLGISEIDMRDSGGGYTPAHICAKGSELGILFEQGENRVPSVWSLFYSLDGKPRLTTEGYEDASGIDYTAMFAISSPHGWAEHWDTSVYAELSHGAEIGTEDVCDNALYPHSESMNKTTDRQSAGDMRNPEPWDYVIRSGRAGKTRPIGKTIGVRVYARLPGMRAPEEWWQRNSDAIRQVKMTFLKQDEIIRRDFNPNRIRGDEYLATEFFQPLGTED